jgi:hypothetical protein
MQFWYRRDMLVPCVWPTALQVSVRRGLVAVPVARFGDVAGNNVWISGDMEF